MDPLRALFLAGVPANAVDRQIERTLKILKLEKWVRIDDTHGFAQFGSPAHVKVAMEALAQAGLEVVASEETRSWVERSARTATVISVTRMNDASLASRLHNGFFRGGSSLNAPSSPGTSKKLPLGPDGTLTDAYNFEDLALLRREVAAFRRQTWELEQAPPEDVDKIIALLKKEEEPSEWQKFLVEEAKWNPPHAAPIEEPKLSNEESGLPASREDLEQTSNSIPTEPLSIEVLVEQIFGEKDADVINFVREHLAGGGTKDVLKTEFDEVLGLEDSTIFADRLYANR